MHTEETQECPTQTQTGSGTSGLALLLSPLSLGSTLTCGNSPTSSIGTTKLCCMSSTTGRRPWPRNSHINSSGMNTWTKKLVRHTTLIGLYIFPRELNSSVIV